MQDAHDIATATTSITTRDAAAACAFHSITFPWGLWRGSRAAN